MPRRRKSRKIVAPPNFKGYKPYGNHGRPGDAVELLYEEYEALKLADYDGMHHLDASKLMGVSRPTFARIYETARRKIAQALVEAKEIRTKYGNAVMDKSWFVCQACHARFTLPPSAKSNSCAICRSPEIRQVLEF